MIFGTLFWDIIFAPIPGAFETPYQAAPLDIAEDSFFYSRQELMEKRLSEIQGGEAANIIRRVDAIHRTSETWCVGVQWDLVSGEDLINIVMVCMLFLVNILVADYRIVYRRGSVVNDVSGSLRRLRCATVWRTRLVPLECRAAHVQVCGGERAWRHITRKSEGKCNLSTARIALMWCNKVWIDVLLRAGVPVEICRVVEKDCGTVKSRSTRARRRDNLKPKITVDCQSSQDEGEADIPPTVPRFPYNSRRSRTTESDSTSAVVEPHGTKHQQPNQPPSVPECKHTLSTNRREATPPPTKRLKIHDI